jgi:hypothetical protein
MKLYASVGPNLSVQDDGPLLTKVTAFCAYSQERLPRLSPIDSTAEEPKNARARILLHSQAALSETPNARTS